MFAASAIQRGRRIAEGLSAEDFNTLIPWSELNKLDSVTQNKIRDFCIGTPEGFVPPENLDFNKLSIEWYFNHSCDGNVGFNQDGDFVALRNIKRGSELTYDYGLAESNPKFKMRCRCGAQTCRKSITGNDWKKEEFRKERIDYMLPRLRKIN